MLFFQFALAATVAASFFQDLVNYDRDRIRQEPPKVKNANSHTSSASIDVDSSRQEAVSAFANLTGFISGNVTISASGKVEAIITGLPAYRRIGIALTKVRDFTAIKVSWQCDYDLSAPESHLLCELSADGNGSISYANTLTGTAFDFSLSNLGSHGLVVLHEQEFCPKGVPLATAPLALHNVTTNATTFQNSGAFFNGKANKADFLEDIGTTLLEIPTVAPTTTATKSTPVQTDEIQEPLPGKPSKVPAPAAPLSKKVTYVDQLVYAPTAAQLAVPGHSENDYNIVNFAFWVEIKGPMDAAISWTRLPAATREAYINAFHSAGKRILISAFGEMDAPATNGIDPIDCANRLAAFVIEYGFDGVDVDFEDHKAFASGKAEPWLIAFTKTLRSLLPSPEYSISHAPQAPLFMESKALFPRGAYITVAKAVGGLIDWYNIQFYNQGNEGYDNCTTLLTKSGGYIPNTSVFEIAAKGIPLSKLVIGKPSSGKGATNSGYVDGATLSKCVIQAQKLGWSAGVMGWNFELDPEGKWIRSAASSLDGNARVAPTTTATLSAKPNITPDILSPEDTYYDPVYGLLVLSESDINIPIYFHMICGFTAVLLLA
ncbi:glycoside hydrolase superfamily [Obelidium mucronatum]|nr:glycoside hydrolase superfamily [Obelidium mucronatum]